MHTFTDEELAAHDREVAARTLEEVADSLVWVKPDVSPCSGPEYCCGSAESCDAMQPSIRIADETGLRARADKISRQDQERIMTFTDRAREVADGRYPDWYDQDLDKSGYHAFMAGALWAVEQDPTDAEVEAAGEALWRRHSDVLERKAFTFDEAPSRLRFLIDARAALKAAQKARQS